MAWYLRKYLKICQKAAKYSIHTYKCTAIIWVFMINPKCMWRQSDELLWVPSPQPLNACVSFFHWVWGQSKSPKRPNITKKQCRLIVIESQLLGSTNCSAMCRHRNRKQSHRQHVGRVKYQRDRHTRQKLSRKGNIQEGFQYTPTHPHTHTHTHTHTDTHTHTHFTWHSTWPSCTA